jgi:monoamine oxidase
LAIDSRVVAGEPLLHIATSTGIPYSNLRRHQHHVVHLVAKRAGNERIYAHQLLDNLDAYEHETCDLQAKAESAGELKTALVAIAHKVRIAELRARIMGEIRDQVHQTSVLNVAMVDQSTARRIAAAFLARPESEVTIDGQA